LPVAAIRADIYGAIIEMTYLVGMMELAMDGMHSDTFVFETFSHAVLHKYF